jgi:uncharacterized membrane protein YgdD (TMEM256/DUF423 family)
VNKEIKTILILSSFFLMLAVLFGAFGAHGLQNTLSEKAMRTFEVGVRYQFYHGFALLMIAGLHTRLVQIKPKWTYRFFIIGIVLFSFNCYLYALTGIKTFAMIVPLGGISFVLGWLMLMLTFRKEL